MSTTLRVRKKVLINLGNFSNMEAEYEIALEPRAGEKASEALARAESLVDNRLEAQIKEWKDVRF
jgi:hypothetical protein